MEYVNDGTFPNVGKWWKALDSRSSVQQAWAAKMESAKKLMG